MAWSQPFSELICSLYHQALDLSVSEFQLFSFEAIASMSPITAATWKCFSGIPEQPQVKELVCYGKLPESLVYCSELDAPAQIKSPVPLSEERSPLVTQRSLRLDTAPHERDELSHLPEFVLQIRQSDRLSGLSYELTLFGERSFANTERQLIQWLMPHLVVAFRRNLLNAHRPDSVAVVEADSRWDKDPRFSEIELQLIPYLADGLSSKEISEKLFLSEKTIRNRLTKIYKTLGVNNRSAAINRLLSYR